MRPKDRPLTNDFIEGEAFDEMLLAWFTNAARVLKPGGSFHVWAGYANLARLAHVSRPRITQIMNLTLLAPDIQEAILFLPAGDGRRGGVGERALRRVCAEPNWRKQRRMWREKAVPHPHP